MSKPPSPIIAITLALALMLQWLSPIAAWASSASAVATGDHQHHAAAAAHKCCPDADSQKSHASQKSHKACHCGQLCGNPACHCPAGVHFAPIVETFQAPAAAAFTHFVSNPSVIPSVRPQRLERPPRDLI